MRLMGGRERATGTLTCTSPPPPGGAPRLYTCVLMGLVLDLSAQRQSDLFPHNKGARQFASIQFCECGCNFLLAEKAWCISRERHTASGALTDLQAQALCIFQPYEPPYERKGRCPPNINSRVIGVIGDAFKSDGERLQTQSDITIYCALCARRMLPTL